MACRIITEMSCDGCGDAYDYLQGHKSDSMRRDAKEKGWVRVKIDGKMQDLCPSCKEETENVNG